MSIIQKTQRLKLMLRKKSNSIFYHDIRELVAMGEYLTTHVSTNLNPADIGIKVLPGGQKREGLISMVLYDLIDDHHLPCGISKHVTY